VGLLLLYTYNLHLTWWHLEDHSSGSG